MIRNITVSTMAIFLLLAGLAAPSAWAAKFSNSNDEKRLAAEVSSVDKDAEKPGGEKAVVKRLEKEFKVDEARINSIRMKKLGYGEVAIVLALASKLPGGINDANANRLVGMRQGPPVMGWGEIAKKLGLKLGPVISGVRKVRVEGGEAGKGEKKEKKEEKQEKKKEEKGEKSGHPEKMERMERNERPDGRGR